MTNIRRNIAIYLLAVVANVSAIAGVHAQMREAKACTDIYNSLFKNSDLNSFDYAPNNVCYSGTNYNVSCLVGMRGDWLDFTDEVTVKALRGGSGVSAEGVVLITDAGTSRDSYYVFCVPDSSKNREGYVSISIKNIRGHGRLRVTAIRPGPMGMGRHSDHFDLEVRDGSRYLEMRPRDNLKARVGQTKTIEIAGRDLRTLRLKSQPIALAYTTTSAARAPRLAATAAAMRAQMDVQKSTALLSQMTTVRAFANTGTSPPGAIPTAPPSASAPEVTLIGATPLMVRLQIKFDRQGIFSLGDYLEFTGGEPDINRDLGWPLIDVKP